MHKRQGIADIPEIFYQLGVRHAVVSPGSRNAPLMLSFIKHGRYTLHSVVDERVAAFYALGISLEHNLPVVLICTSGTALLNYAPAMAEAFYRGIPLVVLSADRPPEFIDQGDGQCLQQHGVFNNFCKKSYQLPPETNTRDDLWFIHRSVSEAFNVSVSPLSGPVHINAPMREPLYSNLPSASAELSVYRLSDNLTANVRIPVNMIDVWRKSKTVMIIAGCQRGSSYLQKALDNISSDTSLIVCAENLSNISSERFISATDAVFSALNSAPEKEIFVPDLLIHLGGQVLSKQMKIFFRNNPPRHHWRVKSDATAEDVFQSVSQIFMANPSDFIDTLSEVQRLNSNMAFQSNYTKIHQKAARRLLVTAEAENFSDLKAYFVLLPQIPADTVLHLANSTPVRYAHLFTSRTNLSYYANRGVSGIDGCLSTAAGHAAVNHKVTTVILGDIAFLYDSNALWIRTLPPTLRIVVVNNGGGNIFRILNTYGQEQYISEYLETPQHADIIKICEAFGLEYLQVTSEKELKNVLLHFYNISEKAKVLEVKTDAATSAEVYKKLYSSYKTIIG